MGVWMCVCVRERENTKALKQYISLSSDLECIIYVIVASPVLILMVLGLIVLFLLLFRIIEKMIHMHYSLWTQTIKNILAFKWCFQLSSNLVHIL